MCRPDPFISRKTHLANPAEIQRYKGPKYADDRHDAFWLAEMLRLGVLPEGYIYPKETRGVRDLLSLSLGSSLEL
jgi:hypothetical protein